MVDIDTHCLALNLVWILAAFIVVVSGRFIKLISMHWFRIHVISGLILLIVTIGFAHIGSESKAQNRLPDGTKKNKSFHKIPGVLVIYGTVALIINGLILRLHNKRMKLVWMEARSRAVHFFGGYGVIILSCIACITGEYCRLGQTEEFQGYWHIALFALCVTSIFCLERYLKNKFAPIFSSENRSFTQKDINIELALGRNIFVFEDQILDLTKYIDYHPGNNLILEFQGQEISRYIYGGFSCGGNHRYNHSQSTYSLISNCTIGFFDSEARKSWKLFDTQEKWFIYNRQVISPIHCIIQFGYSGLIVPGILSGVNHCGRYMVLASNKMNVKRIYSMCFLNDPNVARKHIELLERDETGNYLDWSSLGEIKSFKKDNVALCIKKQEYLSKWIHEMELHEDSFMMKGPYGPGLELKSEESGTIVLVALGTAIVAFADLIGYFIRKLVYEKMKQNDPSPIRIFEDEKFDYLLDTKIILFYSVKNESEALHLDLCKALNNFCKAKDLQFCLELRDSSQGQRRWDSDFFKHSLSNVEVSRVFVASVSGAERQLRSTLIEAGIKRELINIL